MSSRSTNTPSDSPVSIAATKRPVGKTSVSKPSLVTRPIPFNTLTPEQRRRLVEQPFGRTVVHGVPSGHGGCEMLPIVDEQGQYQGGNPWRGKRKPSLADYEGHE